MLAVRFWKERGNAPHLRVCRRLVGGQEELDLGVAQAVRVLQRARHLAVRLDAGAQRAVQLQVVRIALAPPDLHDD
jgi:hypothetical protein